MLSNQTKHDLLHKFLTMLQPLSNNESAPRPRIALSAAAILILSAFFSAPAQADDAVVPAQAAVELAGQAEDFRTRTDKLLDLDEPLAPTIETTETPQAAPAGQEVSFLVSRVLFEGNTIFSSAELQPLAAPLIGRTVTLGDLQKVAVAVTDKYRAAGYINSRAYIGPQKITDGVIALSVIEAQLGRINISGARYFSTAFLEEATRLPQNNALQYSELEERLRFLNLNPDLRVSAFLAAGAEPKTTDLEIKVDDRFPLHGYYEFNNEGTKLTHRSRHLLTGVHNNFLGRSDTLSVTAAMAEQGAFDAISGGWSIPLWRTGTTFQISGSYVQSLLVKHLKSAEIEGLSWSVTPSVTQILVNSPKNQISIRTAFEIKDSKTSVDDEKASLDQMRVLVFGPRWTSYDSTGRSSVSADLHWGIPNLMGGSEDQDLNAGRAGTGGDFDYYTVSGVRVQRLPAKLIGIFRGEAQWSDGDLVSMEQMRLGGVSSVRGYPESDSAGDYGFVGSAELLEPFPVSDEIKIPITGERLNQAVRLAGFVDAGKVFNYTRSSSVAVKDRMLVGAGFGLRVDLKNSLSIRFDYAWPLGDDSTDQGTQPQAHISVRMGY
jgi:hemolysin activation/secretion protein